MDDPADDPRPDRADQFLAAFWEPSAIATTVGLLVIFFSGLSWWLLLVVPLAWFLTLVVYGPLWTRWNNRRVSTEPEN